jgi:proline dehydrogenase
MRLLTFFASRFVAGDTASDAVAVVRKLNERGISATLDFLGEECVSLNQAAEAASEIRRLFRMIADNRLDSNVSIKPTQLGLNLDPMAARENLASILDEAARFGNFVRVDMEGSAYTQATLDLFGGLFSSRKNVGIVIQSYLHRSAGDIDALVQAGARVRLCKGAYKEPASTAFQDKAKVNENYDLLARRLLDSGIPQAIATHDDERIEPVLRYASQKGVPKERVEFQMLLGLRSKRWDELRALGYPVRIYVPYGTHWFPYFWRRLRERKENVLFVLRNFFS